MSRRESEPVLGRPRQVAQMKTSLTSSSSSSSFMNTMQNAKFFQQNSLGSEEPEEEDKEAMRTPWRRVSTCWRATRKSSLCSLRMISAREPTALIPPRRNLLLFLQCLRLLLIKRKRTRRRSRSRRERSSRAWKGRRRSTRSTCRL